MRFLPKSKRGEIQNLMYAGIGLFVLAIMIIVAAYVYGQINDGLQGSTLTANAKAANQGIVDKYPSYFDTGMLFLIIGLILAVITSSALILLHPLLAILYVFALVIVTYILSVLSNAYQDIVYNSAMNATAASFPITNSIMGWLPVIVFFFGLICGAVMFKIRSVMQA